MGKMTYDHDPDGPCLYRSNGARINWISRDLRVFGDGRCYLWTGEPVNRSARGDVVNWFGEPYLSRADNENMKSLPAELFTLEQGTCMEVVWEE